MREEIISTTAADIRNFADAMADVAAHGRVIVLGSEQAIEAANSERPNLLSVSRGRECPSNSPGVFCRARRSRESAKNRAYKPEPKKHIVMTLVERGGKARSFHVKNTTAKTLRETAVKVANRKSYLMTDENAANTKLGKEFSGHGTVNHCANEYARLGGFIHVNNAENYFSIFKRGVYGTYHHISEQHLDRYLAEFDFRYNNRSRLGIEDVERAARTLKGIEGKRLTYRQPREAAHA